MKPRDRPVAIILGVVCIAVVILFAVARFRGRSLNWAVERIGGTWTLTLPAGFTHTIAIEPAGPARFRIDRLVFAGVYELEGDRLVIVEPKDPRLTPLVWERDTEGGFVLVEEPSRNPTGATYLGARLQRPERKK